MHLSWWKRYKSSSMMALAHMLNVFTGLGSLEAVPIFTVVPLFVTDQKAVASMTITPELPLPLCIPNIHVTASKSSCEWQTERFSGRLWRILVPSVAAKDAGDLDAAGNGPTQVTRN